ncbi:hypothetical protein BC834DRAFT_417771 [Gloeopeniophorella convolvens]|nr:hypothetical protein BC834DRAFT_417771 [Gloeopeniophorella convolvens]
MTYMASLGQRMLLLNLQENYADLLDKESCIYIDRPRFIMASEFIECGMATALVRSTEVHRSFSDGCACADSRETASVRSSSRVTTRSKCGRPPSLFAARLPTRLNKYTRRTSASMIMSVMYDPPPIEVNDGPNVAKINKHNDRVLTTTQLGAYWVEFSRGWGISRAGSRNWKQTGKRYHEEANTMFRELFSSVQNDLETGIDLDRPIMSATLIRQQKHLGLPDVETV